MYNPVNGTNNNGSFGENEFSDVNNGNANTNLSKFNVWGFKISEFDTLHSTNVVNVTNTTELLAALSSLSASGGTINVAAGSYTISSQLNLPSNIIIQGAGILSTFFNVTGGHLGLTAKHKTNIVIRDIKFSGDSTVLYGVYLWYCYNVLIERCNFEGFQHIDSAKGYSVYLRHIWKLTMRFCNLDGANNDGLRIKDFDSNYSTSTLASAEYVSQSSITDGGGNPSYGSLFSKEIIIHSNTFTNNLKYGASLYNNTTEFAGNLIQDNSYGLRLSNTQNSLIHDNLVFGSAFQHQYAVLFENGYSMEDVLYSGLCVYNNVLNNAVVGLKFLNVGGAFLSNSEYTTLTTPLQYIAVDATLTTCAGSIEATTYSITINNSDCSNCIPIFTIGQATISISVFNNGPEDANDVVFNFTINGLNIIGISTTSGTGNYTSSSATATIGSIAYNTSVTVEISLSGNTGSYVGVGTLTTSSPDSNLANNSGIVQVTI